MEWINREEWRRKIKLKGEKDVNTLIFCTKFSKFLVAQKEMIIFKKVNCRNEKREK